MKKSKGFFYLSAVILIGVCLVVVLSTLETYGKCVQLAMQQKNLLQAWNYTCQAADEVSDGVWLKERQIAKTALGVAVMEVRTEYAGIKCTLFLAQEE